MSISATMSNALSGLNAASRAAELVSSNVANAMTAGYGPRELLLGAQQLGGKGQGVAVLGVQRVSDPVVIADRRLGEAAVGDRDVRATALRRIEAAIGSPEVPGSLSDRIAQFDAALIEAASRPSSDPRLSALADTAHALATALRDASDEVQGLRMAADAGIAADVRQINAALEGVAELNAQIARMSGPGRDASALIDQRQQLIDTVSAMLPLREIARDNGTVALYTTGGAALLDGTKPSVLGFDAAGMIVPEMTLASGALSGLTLNGRPVDAGLQGLLGGGTLAAQFNLRDQLAPGIQAGLDALARDLVQRFEAPGPDPTLAPGAPGLFTDQGAAFDPLAETGLAARIAMNALVDPSQGGAVWRLRAGLGATTPGPVGEAGLLVALGAALNAPQTTASGSFADGTRGVSDLAALLISDIASRRLSAEAEFGFANTRTEALRQAELAGGVDTDREMQSLLLIERAYGANARVVQAADEMIRRLLEI